MMQTDNAMLPQALEIFAGAGQQKHLATEAFIEACEAGDFDRAEAWRLIAVASLESELDAFSLACRSVVAMRKLGLG